MNRHLKLILWMILQAILVNYVVVDYRTIHDAFSVDYGFIYDILCRPQKLFLNNALLFVVLESITQILYMDPIYRVRYGNKLFRKIVQSSIVNGVGYTIYTVLIILEFALVLGADIRISSIRGIVILLLVVFQFAIAYNILYVISRNYTVATVATFLIYLCFSMVLISLEFYGVAVNLLYSALESIGFLCALDVIMVGGFYAILQKTEVV